MKAGINFSAGMAGTKVLLPSISSNQTIAGWWKEDLKL
jgi:hypothetical protein